MTILLGMITIMINSIHIYLVRSHLQRLVLCDDGYVDVPNGYRRERDYLHTIWACRTQATSVLAAQVSWRMVNDGHKVLGTSPW